MAVYWAEETTDSKVLCGGLKKEKGWENRVLTDACVIDKLESKDLGHSR